MRTTPLRPLALAFVITTPATPLVASALPPLGVLARTGQQIPGAPPGTVMRDFGVGSLSSTGHVGFTSGPHFLVGPPGAAAADLHVAASIGDPAPGLEPGITFAFPLANRINARGDYATARLTRDPSGQFADQGLWMGAPGQLSPVALHGRQAPDLPAGVRYNLDTLLLERFTLSDSGVVAFGAGLTGPGVDLTNSRAIFRATPGDVRLVARAGDPAPGLGDGVSLGEMYLHGHVGPRINASGVMTFLTSLAGPAIEPGSEWAVWTAGPAGLSLAARTGAPVAAAGVPDATLYSFHTVFPTPAINNAGQVAFPARLAGAGLPAAGATAVILADSSGLTSVARFGDPAPGMPDGWIFAGTFFRGVRLNGAGQVLLSNTIVHPDAPSQPSEAVYLGAPGDLRLVARTGGPAPGLPHNATFSDLNIDSAVTNARGQVAFVAGASFTTPAGVRGAGGIWAFDPVAGLFPVLLSDQSIELAPGDHRFVTSAYIMFSEFIGNSGGQDGFAGNLSDTGELVFLARFTDGTEAILTTTIPAPAAAAPVLGGLLCIARRRRAPGVHR